MDAFLAGTPVTLNIPLADRNGNALDVLGVEFRVIKTDGTELVTRQAVAGYTAGEEVVQIVVPATANELPEMDPASITSSQIDAVPVREARIVELFLNVDGNTIVLNRNYALEPAQPLVVGLNSFQALADAELVALDIPSLVGWAAADEQSRTAALIDARQSICQLSFSLLNSNVNWGQDNLNYVPEGSYPTPHAGGFMFSGNLALLTPTHFASLPSRFKAALCRAQVVQADALLDGNPFDQRRQEGLVLETIGESKQMFRSGKPLDLPVCKRALRYLAPFVSFSKRIGRG